MVIMVLEKVPASVRGELSRWMIEVQTGVFIGQINARVRDRLWEKCITKSPTGGVLQAWSSNTEQHFQMRMHGNTSRIVVEEEGLQLIKIPGQQLKFIKRQKKEESEEISDKIKQ